jgi:hypothetical protein
MFETYMARRGVLAANAIKKLEDYRDRTGAPDAAPSETKEAAN